MPCTDRVLDVGSAVGVEIGEWRASCRKGDGRIGEQSCLGPDAWHVAGAKELERDGENCDLDRNKKACSRADQCHAKDRCDQRACTRVWKLMAPQPVGDDQPHGSGGRGDAEHLGRRQPEDDESRHHGGQQGDTRDEVVGKGGRFEGSPVEPGSRTRQHVGIVGKEPPD